MNVGIKNIMLFLAVFCFWLECIGRVQAFIEPHLTDPPFESIQLWDHLGAKGVKYGKWKSIKLNKYGFNDRDDYDKERKEHAIRILCLGDSITFGTFTPPYNWPNLLEKMLRDKGVDAEVINAAFPGNDYPQIIKRFETEYVQFKPDIVLIYKGFNSYMAKPASLAREKSPEVRNTWRQVLENSTFMKKLLNQEPADPYKRLIGIREEMKIHKVIENIQAEAFFSYKQDLEHLIDVCKTNKIKAVLTPFPTLVGENTKDVFIDYVYAALCWYPSLSPDAYIKGTALFNECTYEVAISNHLLYVDILKGLDRNKKYFWDNYHLTVEGARQVAKNYAEALEGPLRDQ